MRKAERMNEGDKVIFTKVPLGSYCKPSEVYLIEEKTERTVYFRSLKNGGGTFDTVKDIEFAEFEITK